ncbi:hypothetical protein KF840_05420 [bacterium]|nr:hypothetical protein [bacterium]
MRNGELRRYCLALVHNRVCAAAPTTDPVPLALGWQLENGRASARAMGMLCGAVTGAGPARWRPSSDLRALLREYHDTRQEGALGARAAEGRPRQADAQL